MPTLPVFQTRTVAPTWEHGLITGSGRVGAVVFGAADDLIVCFSHERFFLPANPRPRAPEIAPALPDIRAALESGDAERASKLVADAAARSGYDDGLIWTDPLGICATVTIATPGGAFDVRRSIDPEHGEIAISWTDAGGGGHTVRALAPRGSETVWIEVATDNAVTTDLTLGLDADATVMPETGSPDYAGVVGSKVSVAGGAAVVRVTAHNDAAVHARTTVTGQTTWALAEGDSAARAQLTLGAGPSARLRIDVTTSPEPASAADMPGRSWSDIRAEQGRNHGALVRASVLDLGGLAAADTTEGIWAAARAGDPDARRKVVEIAYLSGRANAIASTGELPPTLQGVWQGTWRPAWSADYTMNGNVQNGGIASLIPTGTPELARSLLDLVLPFLDDYRDNAARIFGADGMLLPARMSTHGIANHFHAHYPHLFWTGCGGWVLRFAADLVSTTGDRSVVDDRLWELVEGVLLFGETATVSRGGFVHVTPGYSPENTPVEGCSPLTTDPTIDIAIFRDAARSARVLGRARGDDSLDERWARLAESLPPYRVADDGTLAEWISPLWPENIAHRHVSQLYPLWYEPDAAFVGPSPEAERLRAAALETISGKIAWRAAEPTAPPGRMEMAFGLVQLGLAAAALGDARSALMCVEWLAVDHWRETLTTTHDAGSIFNLDASGGLPAIVAAMLLGSTEDVLTLLPALPEEWERGSVTGLRGRAGIVADRLEWDPRGCTLTVRRLAEAHWLRPDGRVRLEARRPFAVVGESSADGTVVVGESPRVIRLEWSAPAT